MRYTLVSAILVLAIAGAVAAQSSTDTIKSQISAFATQINADIDAVVAAEQVVIAGINTRLDADDINFQNLNTRLAADESSITTNTSDIATLKQQVAVLQAAVPASSGVRLVVTTANLGGTITVTVGSGHRLLILCTGSGGLTDNIGTTYQQLGQTLTSSDVTQAVYLSPVVASGGSINLTCASAGEIYVTELSGTVASVTVGQATGSASPATANVTAEQDDLVVAFCVTWTCSSSAGWTNLSTYKNNLLAADIPPLAGSVTASFPVNHSWALSVVAIR